MKAKLMISALLVAFSLSGAEASKSASAKPNILFIFADDWGRHASIYAAIDGPGTVNDVIQTPNFDRLATEGVLFRSAFVSAPSCTPCRSALLSGQHFWRTGRGAILRGAVWDGSNPSFLLMLEEAGYHVGKSHKVWSPGTPVVSPWGGAKNTYEDAGNRICDFSEHVTAMVEKGKKIQPAKEEIFAEVDANFSAFLAKRKSGQPFCYWFGPTQTHRKWIKGSGKALWGIDPEALKGKMPPYIPDVPEAREDMADYFGEAQSLDISMGVLRKKLEEMGELNNTMIVISGDHGIPGFPHGKCDLYDLGAGVPLAIRWGGAKPGRVVDDLISLTDLAPTFLELGGVQIPKNMTGRSLVGILKSSKSGLVEPKRDAAFIGRERHVERARADYSPYPQRALRTHDFLYIVNFRPDRYPLGDLYGLDSAAPPSFEEIENDTRATIPDVDASPMKAWLVTHRNDPKWKPYFERAYGKRPREELYDIKTDPHQVKNVAKDPQYANARAQMEKRLMDELKRTGDPRLIDEGKFFETPPMAGPTDDAPAAKKGKARKTRE
jgi:N-sulfoglucosamine sulfohydrolase